MKEKKLMSSFFAANLVDVGLTAYAKNLEGFREVGIGASDWVEADMFEEIAVARTAVTALLIGAYALAKENGSKLAFTYEESLKIGNVLWWGANVFNAAQIIHHIAQNT